MAQDDSGIVMRTKVKVAKFNCPSTEIEGREPDEVWERDWDTPAAPTALEEFRARVAALQAQATST